MTSEAPTIRKPVVTVAVDISATMQARDCAGLQRIVLAKNRVTQLYTHIHHETIVRFVTFGRTSKKLSGFTEFLDVKAKDGESKMGEAIGASYLNHKSNADSRGLLFLITDDVPSDEDAVLSELTTICKEVADSGSFKVFIFRVGESSPEMMTYLSKLQTQLDLLPHNVVRVQQTAEVDLLAAFEEETEI